MKKIELLLIVLVLAAVAFLLLMLVPGGASIRGTVERIGSVLVMIVRELILSVVLVLGVLTLGLLVRVFIDRIDERRLKETKISGNWHFIFAVFVGIICMIIHEVITVQAIKDDQLIHLLFSLIGLGGPFETAPASILIYGFLAGFIGYWLPDNDLHEALAE